jgi:hypothetical protein
MGRFLADHGKVGDPRQPLGQHVLGELVGDRDDVIGRLG